MQVKAIIAAWIFAVTSLAIVALSHRQLAATRQADRKIAVAVGVSSTFEELSLQSHSLEAGEFSLEEVDLDGRHFERRVRVEETADGTALLVRLTLKEKGKVGRPLVYETSFSKE